ncbi:oxygen-dependent coproporphyrinogen oxidase [Taibaiella lutea]|uniref:coproporphyrinogen oxidase n=1 Tax=Taibaiella lutea TaxID=2608001 RepID=A0A5M6CNV1_9BACT|nr:oxygen-dependent coproporphyrinogen oxidase [Taibaiella lutea]KAA5534829.1 oxygen-dependent coproporphyrinogen oxidase [Taibaiella lutea]
MVNFKDKWINFIHSLQDEICAGLESVDGKALFVEDKWERAEGGGGKTRVISNGGVFEKGGVNTSVVFGTVSEQMKKQLGMDGHEWFACGLSLVLHPSNPFVPTVHANWRYFELYNDKGEVIDQWFGGGSDLTPYYLFDEDARHFHQTLKDAITLFDETLYALYKKQCDGYFVNYHRGNETRGIGGVFYDHLKPSVDKDLEWLFKFQQANGNAFLKAYLPIVEKRKDTAYSEANKYWQEIRRGRYVEFNLLHDRGTIFGLKTNGRTESILMSLPPTVRFDYNFEPAENSEEARLSDVCRKPIDWI